jgi:hypothetical protein
MLDRIAAVRFIKFLHRSRKFSNRPRQTSIQCPLPVSDTCIGVYMERFANCWIRSTTDKLKLVYTNWRLQYEVQRCSKNKRDVIEFSMVLSQLLQRVFFGLGPTTGFFFGLAPTTGFFWSRTYNRFFWSSSYNGFFLV